MVVELVEEVVVVVVGFGGWFLLASDLARVSSMVLLRAST